MSQSKTLNILHVVPELKEGGVERGVIDISLWQASHGFNVIVVSKGGPWTPLIESAGIKHIALPVHRKNPIDILRCSLELNKIAAREDIHIICAHSRAPAWSAHLATRTSNGKSHNPPLIMEAQAFYEPFWYSRVMCWGDKIIVPSEGVKKHLINKLGAISSKISVIPRGIDFKQIPQIGPNERLRTRSGWNIPNDAFLIVGVGRLSRIKGWDDLISAIRILTQKHGNIDIYCVLVGSSGKRQQPYIKELKDKIRAFNLQNRILFAGHRDDIFNVFSAADCAVAPSRYPESFGRVVVEALISGCPVIATSHFGVIEFLGSEYENFVVPPQNPESIAERLCWVVEHKEETNAIVSNLAYVIKDKLSLENQMAATMEIYMNSL